MATAVADVDLQQVRQAEFPIVNEWAYLNAASQGPWPVRAVRTVERVAALGQYPNTPRALAEPSAEAAARERLARVMGTTPANIVFTANTTNGISICAQGIDWRPGDNAVVPAREFPSLGLTWLNLEARGVEVRQVPVTGAGPSLEALLAAADERTRAIACSAVSWDTGFRLDLARLGAECRRRGILLIVDGIQLVGARRLEFDQLGVAAMATHGYKWLMSGFGLGALAVAPWAMDQIRPLFISSNGVVGDPDLPAPGFQLRPDARRYQAGGGNRTGLAILAASLSLTEEVGIDRIEVHSQALADIVYTGLAAKPSVRVVTSPARDSRSAIVTFTTGSRAGDEALQQRLETAGVIVALRPLGLRASPHFYNDERDVARLLDAV